MEKNWRFGERSAKRRGLRYIQRRRRLLEAELFGHERGAFAGAVRTRRGVFEQAEGGTLFLDEVGEMTPGMQAKLLRAVQEREIVRVGGEKRISVRVRLICATNRELQDLVVEGRFRQDLYYRINVIHLRLPALRERRDDIRWFARMFLAEQSRANATARRLSVAAESALLAHSWPGNIRELRHAIERACILSRRSALEPEDLFETATSDAAAVPLEGDSTLNEYLQRCERYFILETLERHGWQIGETARVLGISRKNLWERMRRLAIAASESRDSGP